MYHGLRDGRAGKVGLQVSAGAKIGEGSALRETSLHSCRHIRRRLLAAEVNYDHSTFKLTNSHAIVRNSFMYLSINIHIYMYVRTYVYAAHTCKILAYRQRWFF